MNDVRKLLLAGISILVMSAAASTLFAQQDAEEVLEKVRERYDDIEDAELRFSQKVRFPMAQIEQQVSGTLFIKKNNKYRVELDDRMIVTDGQTVWSYSASNNQVIIDKFKQDERTLSPEKILVGTPDNFTATVVGEERVREHETTVLKLTPKDDQSFVRSLRLWVDDQDGMIRQVELVDMSDKRTTYSVLEARTNTGLQDSQFVYEIPEGADVVDLR